MRIDKDYLRGLIAKAKKKYAPAIKALAPCAFCGLRKHVEMMATQDGEVIGRNKPVFRYRIFCRKCYKGDIASWSRKDAAIESWNSRTRPETKPPTPVASA